MSLPDLAGKTILLAALFLAPAASFAASAKEKAGPAPEELVRQLGADSFADREAAEKRLTEAGFPAREAVRKAKDSTDPEVRMRAGRVWERLRWLAVPGMTAADLPGLLGSPRENPDVCHNWDGLIAGNGGAVAPLVLLMWEDDAQRANAVQVMWQLLARMDTKTLSEALSRAATDSACTPDSLRTLLLAVPSANTADTGRKTAAALAALQNALWLHEDAMNLSVRSWLAWRNEESLRACCAAVSGGGLQEKLWADFDPSQKEKGLFAVTYGSQRDTVMLLYVRLAAMLNTPARLAGKVAVAEPEKSPEADEIISTLAAMGLAGEAVRALENASGPRALYLRFIARTAAGDAKKAEADRAAALKAIEDAVGIAGKDGRGEDLLYGLAEIMARHNDAGAEALYRKITTLPPENSVYDSNAWLRLGQIAEARREYGRAADCYEKTVETARKGSFFFSITGDDGESCYGDAAFDLMRRRIEALRAKGK